MLTSDRGSVSSNEYLKALANFIRTNEINLANFNTRRQQPINSNSNDLFSNWTSILTLGLISSDSTNNNNNTSTTILNLNSYHLYFLLLKIEKELNINNLGNLNILIKGSSSTNEPISMNYTGLNSSLPGQGVVGGLDSSSSSSNTSKKDSDSISFKSTLTSSISNFNLNLNSSNWWSNSNSNPLSIPSTSSITSNSIDSTNSDLKYIYSSMTKLPALKLTPFTFPTSTTSNQTSILSKPIKDFQNLNINTLIPLNAFKNLSHLIIEDLNPRKFSNWDNLSFSLKFLEIKRSGIEDLVGQLLCFFVVEDFERNKNSRDDGGDEVGEERIRRRRGNSLDGSSRDDVPPSPSPVASTSTSTANDLIEDEVPTTSTTTTNNSNYPIPPPSSWSQLKHLSLNSNSLTFIPTIPLNYLKNLTSLDLSSNFLCSIPIGLNGLECLRSLDLSGNLIEDLSGFLGFSDRNNCLKVLNLSKNKLKNLIELEKISFLERLDIRFNLINDSLEISTLAKLSNLQEIYIENNPFSSSSNSPQNGGGGEDSYSYRIKCFNFFIKEGNEIIKLDGTGPTLIERRVLNLIGESRGRSNNNNGTISKGGGGGNNRSFSNSSAGRNGNGNAVEEEAKSAGETKIVIGRRNFTTPHPHHHQISTLPSTTSSTDQPSTSTSTTTTTVISPVKAMKKRKPRRIVDLDLDATGTSPTSSSNAFPSPPASSTSTGRIIQQDNISDSELGSNNGINLLPTTSYPTTSNSTNRNNLVGGNSRTEGRYSALSTSLSQHYSKLESTSLGPSNSNNSNIKQSKKERIPIPKFPSSSSSPSSSHPTSSSTSSPSTTVLSKEGGAINSSEVYRKKIEELRNEVGENWLAVLGERENLLVEREEREKAKEREMGKEAGEGGESVVKVVSARNGKGKGKEKKKKEVVEAEDGRGGEGL